MSQAAAKARDRIVGAALLLLSVAVVAAAWRLPETAAADAMGPKAYPMALALVLAVLSLVLMRGGGNSGGATLTRDMVVYGFLPILAMLALYVLLVPVLGFVICTVALLLACFRLKGERSWKVNFAVALGSSLAIWALFAWLLNVQLRLLPSFV